MRIKLFVLAGAIFGVAGCLAAGTLELQPKETAPPTISQSEPWQFTIAAPGWLASMNGTIGVRGVNADIDVPVDEVLQHLDMIFAARAEARKGPFGIYGEVIYIGLSDGAQINGLINNIHEQVDMTLVDGGLSWRLVNQPRWSLDFAAGTHYTNVYEKLELHSDPIAIQKASERFVNDIAEDLRDRLNHDISKGEFVDALKDSIRSVIASRIGDRLEDHQRHPNIPIGPLAGRIQQEIAQRVENFIQETEAALRARIDALHLMGEARREAVQRAVNAAKVRITNQLALRLNKSLSQTLSKDDFWFDPYVGLRGRYNFNKTYYTAVRGDIAGFGVGADWMWDFESGGGSNLPEPIL